MIETEQTIAINAAIESVWDYVSDIRKWAQLMPGMRECTVVDANDSRWTLKVGVGGLVRTVNVIVHVDKWDGPGRVDFTYKLDGDPVAGGGTYLAARKSAGETDVTLKVRVEGGGPLAPMWEAMGKPLLPQLAKSFGEQLKAEIEKSASSSESQSAAAPASRFALFAQGFRNFWRALFGPKGRD